MASHLPDPDAALAEDDAQELSYVAEVMRKAIHLVALVVPFGMWLLGREWSLWILTPLMLVAVAMDVLRVRSASVARFVDLVFGPLMRREERPPVGGPVSINGATWVLITAVLLAVLFPIRLAVAAFVMFMLSDAAAALVGRRYGRHRWGTTKRTVEGSAAFFLTGTLVMALLPGVVFWTGTLAALVGAAAEIPPRPLNDNIRVPVMAALTLLLLERYVLGIDVALLFF